MIASRIIGVGIAMGALVLGIWFLWLSQIGGTWPDFEALGVLFSGFAFVGLLTTIVLQVSEIKAEDAKLREAIDRAERQTEAHAHAAFLGFAERRIEYLTITALEKLHHDEIFDEAERERVIVSLKVEIKDSMVRLAELKRPV